MREETGLIVKKDSIKEFGYVRRLEKGKIEDINFIAYINAETGEEEDILIVANTENGTLTE